jgi:hypothetical protein
VAHSHEVKSPRTFTDSKSYSFGMKRHPTEPNIFSSISESNNNKNVKPDRDLSPQFHKDVSFKKNSIKSPEHEVLMSAHLFQKS